MEIRAYTSEFLLLGIIENYSSLIWTRKYSDVGNFEIHVPVTSDNIRYFCRGNIVAYVGAVEAGVIEHVGISQSTNKNELTIKGRFLESYLDRRLIYNTFESPTYNFSGRVELGMRQIVKNTAIDRYPIPNLELGAIKGFSDEISFQATYQNLLKYEGKLANSADLGFRINPDFVNKKMVFNVYKGLDHTESQFERTRVIFSDEYRNINTADYTENDQLLKTTCFVGGQGTGAERTWVKVGDHTLSGLERREVKLDATDVNPDELTQSEYVEKLSQRGNNLLETQDIIVKSFECDVIPQGNFVYKEHYDLGDIVTIEKDNWGLSIDLRITEIQENYEHGKATIIPTFGNPLPSTIDWEDK